MAEFMRHVRRPRCLRGVVAAVAVLCATVARGATVEWLYDVEAPVASSAPADRSAAARQALGKMLTRLTGLRELPRSDPVIQALDAPERFYQRYRFVFDEGEAHLAVSFAPEALRDLVSRAALPVWGADRPVALAWIVVEAGAGWPGPPATMAAGSAPGRRFVLASGSDHPLAEGIERRMRQRGIEVRLPLMDLEDRGRVSPAALWNRYAYTIREASARYRPDYMVLGRVRQEAGGAWRGDWELWLEGRQLALQANTPDAGAAAAAAVDAAADELARRFAVTGAQVRPLRLQVAGANSVAEYAKLLRHLEELAFVDRVDVLEATAETVTLLLATRSSRDQLANLLTESAAFQPWPHPLGPLDAGDATAMRVVWGADGTQPRPGGGAEGTARATPL